MKTVQHLIQNLPVLQKLVYPTFISCVKMHERFQCVKKDVHVFVDSFLGGYRRNLTFRIKDISDNLVVSSDEPVKIPPVFPKPGYFE